MTTLASDGNTTPASTKERRPFLWIHPQRIPRVLQEISADAAGGLAELEARVGDDTQLVVRSLVNYTVAVQNRRSRSDGRPLGVTVGVLNRRRRAARAWIVAILQGRVDRATLHALTHTWLPQLAGTGPDAAEAVEVGERYLEYLRGAITSLLLQDAEPNLVPAAKALHALESILSVQLQALREVAPV